MPYVSVGREFSVHLDGLLEVSHGTAAMPLSGEQLEELALLLHLKLVQVYSASIQCRPLGEAVPTTGSIFSKGAFANRCLQGDLTISMPKRPA